MPWSFAVQPRCSLVTYQRICASLADKTLAASCHLYFLTAPYRAITQGWRGANPGLCYTTPLELRRGLASRSQTHPEWAGPGLPQ